MGELENRFVQPFYPTMLGMLQMPRFAKVKKN
jgi:hypothetical protein